MEVLNHKANSEAAVLVIHSWWGLTDSFRRYGNRLAQAGFVVGLADLFAGQTACTEEDAKRLRAQPRRVPMYRTLENGIESLRRRVGNPECPVGVVGFSMGGHWAVWLSQRAEYRISSTTLYYSARAGDFSRSQSEFQAHFAEVDEWVSKSARNTMEKAIGKAGRHYRSFEYPGTKHWFAEACREAEFNPEAGELALERDIQHLYRSLRTASMKGKR